MQIGMDVLKMAAKDVMLNFKLLIGKAQKKKKKMMEFPSYRGGV